jgi:beta-1,3-galactosyltransferase 1
MIRLRKKLLLLLVFSILLLSYLGYEIVKAIDFNHNRALYLSSIIKFNNVSVHEIIPINTSVKVNSVRYNTSDLFRLTKRSNHHNFNILQNPQIPTCGSRKGSSISILVLVIGPADHFEHRDAIRKSWANTDFIGIDLGVMFLLGTTDDWNVNSKIRKESSLFKDLLQENFIDSRQNNTLKVIMGFKWTSMYCENVNFILKVNDNTVVNSNSLLNKLKSVQSETDELENVIMGDLVVGAAVNRNKQSMYYISELEYNKTVYYPYCQEAAYILTFKLATALYDLSEYVFWPPFSYSYEDIYIGTLAVSLGAHFVQIAPYFETFTFEKIKSSRRKENLLFVHVEQAYEIRRAWVALNPNETRALKPSIEPFDSNKLAVNVNPIPTTEHGTIKFNLGNFLKMEHCINSHNAKLVLNPYIRECKSNTQLLLLALVIVSPDSFKKRMMIRNTWAQKDLYGKVLQVVFVMGLSKNETVNRLIRQEFQTYQDIVQEDFYDSYGILTAKVIAGFKWASSFCKSAYFVLRVNDDVFVNIPVLSIYLSNLRRATMHERSLRNIMLGNLYPRSVVMRNESNKFYISQDEYSQSFYYPYFEGLFEYTSFLASIDSWIISKIKKKVLLT